MNNYAFDANLPKKSLIKNLQITIECLLFIPLGNDIHFIHHMYTCVNRDTQIAPLSQKVRSLCENTNR